MTAELDASNLPEHWAEALAKRGCDQDDLGTLVADIYDKSPVTVFPERSDLFRAFHLTRLEDVRAVILGQDPYPRPKQAHGLAFSVPNGVAIPRSLKTIYTNLENDPAIQISRPHNGDLTSWAKNGVLLLNTALTVEEGGPGSHARRWKHFTDLVLQVINEECAHVAFLLWGSHAIRKATSIPINEPPHKVIRSAHPAARGKTNEERFKDCHPFSEANDFLTSHQLEPVTWDLGANEPPFVGEQRHELVERLLAEFDHVSQSGRPRWWSLEEHSGWGKTRIVQELYRRLAAERQPGAKYWPPSLLPRAPVLGNAGPWMSMRRRVYPEQVVPEHEAVPQWFWWGISCATRSGTPVQALADDLTQFVEHQVGLEQRWRQLASPKARLGAEGSAEPGEVVETAAGEVLGVAAGLANLPVPGLGVLALTAKWGVPGRRDGRLLAQGSPVAEAAGRIRSDLVDELAPALERLGAAGLPIVITIEDLHLADESLVELLARILAAQGAPVLVISTAWRGLLDEDSRPAHRLIERVEPDRICRVLTDKALPDLATSERQVIVSATLPDASAWNANLLAQTYTNPLALQLACNVGWVRQAQRNLTADDVAGLPRDVDGLFTQLWKELPEDTCQALMVATLSTPTAISESLGFGDARWDSSLLTAVSKTEAWPRASAADLSAVLAQTSDASAWVRSVDQWLRRFPDPVQYDVAVGQAKVEYDDAERRLLYEAMARGMSPGVVKSPSQRLHRARLLVALASEGFLAWDETTLTGAVTLCSSLLAGSDSNGRRHVIRIVESALRSTSTEPPVAGPLLTLRGKYERALAESGRVAEAITAFEQLLADQRRALGPDAPDTLTTRGNLAELLARSGRVAEAITACEQLLADRTRVQGPDALDTLTTRGNLASWLARSGRLAEVWTIT